VDGLATFTDLFIGKQTLHSSYRLTFSVFLSRDEARSLAVTSGDVHVALGPACCLEVPFA
jgi:hypothetical protein